MPQFDDTDHPLIRMTLTGAGGPGGCIAFMSRIDTLIDGGERFVLVIDDGTAHLLSGAGQWRRVLPWAVRRRRQLKRTCAAVAVTVDPAALARAERATRKLARLIPAPLSIFIEADMADQWVHSRLASGDGRLVPARERLWRPVLVPYRALGSDQNP